MGENSTKFLFMVLFVAIFLSFYFNSNTFEGFNSNYSCSLNNNSNLNRVVLNGVGQGNLSTGTFERTINSNGDCVFRLEANLPETQLTFDYHLGSEYKTTCKCSDNCDWDSTCNCGAEQCSNYFLYIVNPNSGKKLLVGKPRRFGDGMFRLYKNMNVSNINDYSQVLLTFNSYTNGEVSVLKGCFAGKMCT